MLGLHLFEFRLCLEAFRLCIQASGSKAAAGGRIDRGRNFTLEDDAVADSVCLCHRDRGQKRLRIGMQLLFKQLVGRTLFHEVSKVHDADLVGDVLNDGKVVGNENVGQSALLLKVLHEVQDLCLNGHIQS